MACFQKPRPYKMDKALAIDASPEIRAVIGTYLPTVSK